MNKARRPARLVLDGSKIALEARGDSNAGVAATTVAKTRNAAQRVSNGQGRPEPDYGSEAAIARANHWEIEQVNPQDRSTRRVRVERDPIDWYLRRNYVTMPQADALKRWQTDAYLSGLMPSCVGSYAQAVAGSRIDVSDTRLAAQARRANAIAFLQRIGHWAVKLIDAVAVDGRPAGKYYLAEGTGTPNQALIHLVQISEALAKHYGYAR